MRPTPEDILQAIYQAAEKGLRVVVVGGPSLGTVDLGATSLAALEEIQVNVTGEGGISTEAALAALLAMLTPGTPEQHVGTAGVSAQTLTFSGLTKHVAVSNPTKNGVLEVSFNGGASFIPFEGSGVMSVPCRVSSMQIRAVVGPLSFGVIAMT